jgi:hypothetical protein
VAAAPNAVQQLAEVQSPAARAAGDTARADKAEAAVAGGRGSADSKTAASPVAGQANSAADVKSENTTTAGADSTGSGANSDSSQHAKPRLHGGIHGRTRSRAGGTVSSDGTASKSAQGGQDSTAGGGSSGRRLHDVEQYSNGKLGGSIGSRKLQAAAADLGAAQRTRRSRQLQQLRQQAAARQRALVPVAGATAAVALPSVFAALLYGCAARSRRQRA